LSFLNWFKDEQDLGSLHGTPLERREKDFYRRWANAIDSELSVVGVQPKLYLPMLAGLTQGPGFPNLSCLGNLSDRILKHSISVLNPNRRMEVPDVQTV
jgi:hypothetical protein